jgi:hypothetical protein
MYAHHVELLIAVDVADCQLAWRAFSVLELIAAPSLPMPSPSITRMPPVTLGRLRQFVAIEIARLGTERDSRRAGSRYRSLKVPSPLPSSTLTFSLRTRSGLPSPLKSPDVSGWRIQACGFQP